MAVLQDILYKVSIRSVQGDLQVEVKDMEIDSRQVKPGTCFLAIRGVSSDGHRFIPMAVSNGASVVICEEFPSEVLVGVTYVQVENSSIAAGVMCHNFYGNPSARVSLVGVTGTNGKTTIATLLYKLFSGLGYRCGLISTVQNHIVQEIVPSNFTTPDQVTLNRLLRQMVDAGCEYVFMECSSHAIHQHRIAGLQFAGGIFSNITHDHLDYHKTFDEYIRVKKAFFDSLPASAFALSNLDDKRGQVMLQNTKATTYYYSLRTLAEFKGKILENGLNGLIMTINEQEVHFRLIGEFNAYNLLAVYGASICLGQERGEVLQVLSNLSGAEGRFDYQVSGQQRIIGIVDYAHTPDALENVLQTIRQLRQGHERIITVVGCGGDRDKTKRTVMGKTACELSDQVFFTSDNPRTEDPLAILNDMETELTSSMKRKVLVIADRKEAIKAAVKAAGPEDIILVAGKGHEKYQEIQGVKHPFDDKAVLQEMFQLFEK